MRLALCKTSAVIMVCLKAFYSINCFSMGNDRKKEISEANRSMTISLPNTLDGETLATLSAQHLDRHVHRVAITRQYVDQHFRDKLGIPTAPCLDILLALHMAADEQMSVEGIANHIFHTVSITLRYLNLMISKELIEMEGQNLRLTSEGAQELSFIIGQAYGEFLQLID